MNPAHVARHGRGRARCGALVLALFSALAFPAARAQVAVEELEVHLRPAPGQGAVTQVIPVRNERDRVQQVRVVLADWERDSLGRNVFLDAGAHAASCGARIQVFPMSFQVAPGAVEHVRVTYDPGTVADGCWSIAFFETVQPSRSDPERPGSYLTIEMRTGVKLYVHAHDARRAAEITFAEVVEVWQRRPGAESDSALVRQADLRVANVGTAHLKARARVELRERSGRLLHTIASPEELYLTPRAVRDHAIALPTLPAGDYVALLLVDYAGDEITAAQVEFRVP